jgi:hypothetical protein
MECRWLIGLAKIAGFPFHKWMQLTSKSWATPEENASPVKPATGF